ncbi:hypothetical protein ACFQT0_23060 [Hymenobacter humi]|uniref:Uncharacterized protein n=1 Tax=Hymenobacter humi TaxID=1411620 RepID=A0ABW2UCV9_9BACT
MPPAAPAPEASALIDQAVAEVRRISRNLQPATLQQAGPGPGPARPGAGRAHRKRPRRAPRAGRPLGPAHPPHE